MTAVNSNDHASDSSSCPMRSSPASPIISSADRSRHTHGSVNDSLWHGGRCLTDDAGSNTSVTSSCDLMGSCKKRQREGWGWGWVGGGAGGRDADAPAAEELECAAALSMLAQLAGMTEERERVDAVAGRARTHGLGFMRAPLADTSALGKRPRVLVVDQMMEGLQSLQSSSTLGVSSASAGPSLDTPPLEPQVQLPALLSPLAGPFDNLCSSAQYLPPIVPKMGPPTML